MAIAIRDVEALVRNARHNTRFAWVRLPVIIVVAGFVWVLCGPIAGLLWISAMLLVERASTMLRARYSPRCWCSAVTARRAARSRSPNAHGAAAMRC